MSQTQPSLNGLPNALSGAICTFLKCSEQGLLKQCSKHWNEIGKQSMSSPVEIIFSATSSCSQDWFRSRRFKRVHYYSSKITPFLPISPFLTLLGTMNSIECVNLPFLDSAAIPALPKSCHSLTIGSLSKKTLSTATFDHISSLTMAYPELAHFSFIAQFPNLQCLYITPHPGVSDNILSSMVISELEKNCPRLTDLTVKLNPMTFANLAHSSFSQKLKRLSMSSNHGTIACDDLPLLQEFKQLQTLHLKFEMIPPGMFRCLDKLTTVTDLSLEVPWVHADLTSTLLNMKWLKSLSMTTTQLLILSDFDMHAKTQRFPALTRLSMNNVTTGNDYLAYFSAAPLTTMELRGMLIDLKRMTSIVNHFGTTLRFIQLDRSFAGLTELLKSNNIDVRFVPRPVMEELD
jgi:hypothetical protein